MKDVGNSITDLADALLHIAKVDEVRAGQKNLAEHLGISSGSTNGLLKGRIELSEKLVDQINEATHNRHEALLERFVGQKARKRKKDIVDERKPMPAKFNIASQLIVEVEDISDLEQVRRLLDMALKTAKENNIISSGYNTGDEPEP